MQRHQPTLFGKAGAFVFAAAVLQRAHYFARAGAGFLFRTVERLAHKWYSITRPKELVSVQVYHVIWQFGNPNLRLPS